MAKTRHFRVLGQTLIYPRGLRKSPGSNNMSRCQAKGMLEKGKPGKGNGALHRQNWRNVHEACVKAGNKGGGKRQQAGRA